MARSRFLLSAGALACVLLAHPFGVALASADELDNITGFLSANAAELEAVGKNDRAPDGTVGTALTDPSQTEPDPVVNLHESVDDCFPNDPTDPCSAGAEAAPRGGPVVTLRDIASFRPAVPVDVLEPGAWGLMGRPVNFVSGATDQVVAGTLLGRPADVRFVPVGFEWSFGDGDAEMFTEPGASWAALGLREFSETPTSHVYEDRGTYDVAPSVTYRAWYRFDGSGWVPIAGTLQVPGTPRSVVIGRIDTVLVKGDCNQYPNGPGCGQRR
ncbi:hypothetical protein ET445_06235 [Agromyces protaetiae]|uniref:PKD domain-containing protein n=1 Tax=Agromyces protaetiae TaxID=2509455 RepID=A0A4P6FAL5_9MICO|nr:hypothetical protein [Agromyces protaetiae]QAY73002.1 hypothetical protein ET445_06235 [Agromyces protaetiae]